MRSLFSRRLAFAAAVLLFAGAYTHLLSEETPYGRVKGSIRAAETGAYLPDVEVALVQKDETQYKTTTDSQGRFTFDRVQSGSYSLTAKTRAHEQPKTKIQVEEDGTARAEVELKPTAPFVRVLQDQQVFTTRETAAFHCLGFVPAKALTAKLYRVAPEVAAARWDGWLTEGLSTGGKEISKTDLDAVPELSLVETMEMPVQGRDIKGVFRQEIRFGKRKPGMYLAALRAGEGKAAARGHAIMTVTDLGLIVKASPEDALVYAVNLDTGAPVTNAEIRLSEYKTPKAQGRTGPDGLLSLRIPPMDENNQLRVVGTAGESMAATTLYLSNSERTPLRAYTYTDRPVYRPGHTVHFKSLLRELANETYRIPAIRQAGIRVTDGKGNLVHTGNAETNAYGSLSGSFDLNENAIPGSYTLSLTLDGKPYESDFRVAEYRKPEFEVTVAPERKRYVQGETVRATVSTQYYFGAPVANAKVNYFVTRSASWHVPDHESWDEDLEFDDGGYGGGESIAEGEGVTDKNGQFRITVPPPPAPASDAGDLEGQDWEYDINATVIDPSHRSESGDADVLVTQGEYRIEAAAEDSVARPGQPVEVAIRAVDYDGKPVPGASGEAALVRVDWLRGREKREEIARQPWRADPKGQGSVALTPPRDGDYRVVVTAADRRGRTITSSAWVWVMGDDHATFSYPYQDLDVRADKKLYKEGETAEIIVNTKHAPTTALLTLEGSKILQSRRVKLAGKTNVLKIPVTPDLMPAAKLNVCFVKGKDMVSGDAVLNVSRERKALKVEVTPDKRTYLPGEAATYRVRTLSPEGEPVPAEVSLGVVDEAIYAVQPETTRPIVSYFYPKQVHEVQTAFSAPDVYLSGDEKEGKSQYAQDRIETRRKFLDTAFWAPATVTDAQGEASFTVTMPDNLTSWRATARAATLNTDVGEATSEAVTQKPFMLRLEAPRFMTQGDEIALAAVAHNMTRAPLTAAVGLEMDGAPAGEAQEVRIEPGDSRRVEWRIAAPEVGDVPVRVWARAGALSDAMEQTLPVLAKGRERSILRSGAVDDRDTVSLDIPKNAIPGTQTLTLRLTPSLASAMLGSLDYLATYPYGCTEQTMSAFLPDLMIVELLDKAGVENPALRQRLPKMVESGLLQLYQHQHEDGGWRWWAYDEADPWMTAYVVFGLQKAKELGFRVTPEALTNGVNALKRMAENPKKIEPDTQAYLAYVLALSGEPDAARGVVARYTDASGAVRPTGLSDWGRPMLALALERLGRAEEGRALLETVWPHFTGGTFAPVDDKKEKLWRSDAEYAAVLLTAAATLTPNDARLPELVRGLLERRRADHWHSTRDTAFALYGLSRYLLASEELSPDMTARVTVNGREVASRRFTPADVFRPEVTIPLDPQKIGPGPVEIVVEKSGTGRLYYSASWSGTVDTDLSKPVRDDSGLVVERHYRVMKPGEAPVVNPKAPPPTGPGQTEFQPGDIVEVTLTLRTARPLDYVMVEDPLPAGFESRDRGDVEPWEWTNWWADQVTRDEGISFAVRHLDPGARTITYRVFAQVPGTYTALPPRIYDMYNPELRGEGAAQSVIVQ
ncbi:MAG: carboxypeptidase regulatory-like domain-containing protein [Armatimonadetes bacterium]|nr:carboxypeptidase regulatory-like domain-containing protein [Armatimonadota bacterium]